MSRHALVRLHPAAWAVELAARPDLAVIPDLAEWADRGRPLVVRRRCAGDAAGRIALGLPLPPTLGKARLGFHVSPEALSSVEPPLPLAAAHAVAPAGWRRTIETILDLSRRHGLGVRAYGSFAWAALTGLPYVTAGSDLDLLWPLASATPDVLAALPAIEADAPGQLDGEVVDAKGAGANWRELSNGAGAVLVKTIAGVALVDRAVFLHGERRAS